MSLSRKSPVSQGLEAWQPCHSGDRGTIMSKAEVRVKTVTGYRGRPQMASHRGTRHLEAVRSQHRALSKRVP
jgi:hypothetical protein